MHGRNLGTIMRTRTCLTVAALCLVGGLTACAGDHMTDGIHPDRPLAEHESNSVPKAEAIVRVAQATAARGDWPMAASLYRRAHSVDGRNFDAALGLADALNRLGAHDQAFEAYQAALALQPRNIEAMRAMGNTLVMLDRASMAIRHYERALEVKEDARTYNGIGVAYDMLDDHKAAQAFYRVGLDMTPANLSLRNNLGLSLMLSGEHDAAVKELRQVVSSPGATVRHRLNLALGLVLSGDSRTAEGIARFDLSPAGARDQVAYFETIKALGQSSEARAAIRAHIRGNAVSAPERRSPAGGG
jgi:Flp pilus assembly protein TadD